MLIRVAGLSDKGPARRKNDDHYCIGPFVEQAALTSIMLDWASSYFQQYGLLVAVADGIGGYEGGDYASRLVLETLSAQYYGEQRTGCTILDLSEALVRYLDTTHRLLCGKLSRSEKLKDAGTTIAGVVLMPPDYLIIFHAGDSRVLRAGAGYARTLTTDHTVVGPDVTSGVLTESEALAIQGGDRLTRSLSLKGGSHVEINMELAWNPGDVFLIGTDGWHGLGKGLSRTAMRTPLLKEQSTEAKVRRLVADALAADGTDNTTLVVVEVVGEGEHGG